MPTYTDRQKVISQMNIAYTKRMSITVFSMDNDNVDFNTNLQIVKLLHQRRIICEQFANNISPSDKENCIKLFEMYNEQIKQLLGL